MSLQIDPTSSVPITPPKDTVALRRRTRSSNVRHALQQIQNPDQVLKKMGKDITAYRDLLVDGHLSSCVQSRKSGVLSLEWEIASGNAPQEVFEFVQEVFNELDIHRALTEMLDAPLFGYSFHEVEWDYSNGRHRVVNVVAKPQEWFRFNEANEPLYINGDQREGEPLPAYKFLELTHQASYINPYGQALLSRCFWPISFKNQLIKFGLIFAEKYGMPYLFGKYDPFEDSKVVTDLHEALLELSAEGVATIPNTTDASLLEAGRSSSVDTYMRFITFFNAEVSKAILSQTLTTEQGDTGSYAMSQTHLMVRRDVVESDRRLCERAFNQLIQWMVDFNFHDAEAPTFRLFEEEDVDAALQARDAGLYTMGFRPRKKYISQAYNIDEDLFDMADAVSPQPTTAEEPPAPFSGVRIPAISRSYLESLPDLQKAGARELSANVATFSQMDPEAANKAMSAMLKPAIDFVIEGRSFEDVQKKLVEIFPDMDDSQLTEALADTIYIADTIGRVSTQ